jgi:hypothetical protein
MENNITEKLGFTKHTTFRKFQGINKRGGVYMYIQKKMYLYMYVKVTFTRCEIVRRHLEHIRNRKRNAICFGFFLYIRLTKNMESQYYNFWSNSYDLWLNSKQNFFVFFISLTISYFMYMYITCRSRFNIGWYQLLFLLI